MEATVPIDRVSRPARVLKNKVKTACNRCRAEKIKCSGDKPICVRCATTGLSCEYAAQRRNRAREFGVSLDAHRELLQHIVDNVTLPDAIRSSAMNLLGPPDSPTLEAKYTPDGQSDTKTDDSESWTQSGSHNTTSVDPMTPYFLISEPDTSKGISPYPSPYEASSVYPMLDYFETLIDSNLMNAAFSWTPVSVEAAQVAHLLKLYFTWVNPFFSFVSVKRFLEDMKGDGRCCSPFLVNAMLALSCQFSGQQDDRFFAEAKRIFQTEDPGGLCSAQALAMIALREFGCGRDVPGSNYLALAVNKILSAKHAADDREWVRTYWAIFNLDVMWASAVGRLPQFPTSQVRLPVYDSDFEPAGWRGYPQLLVPYMGYFQATFVALSALSRIVTDILCLFHSGLDEIDESQFSELYYRLIEWFEVLPASLKDPNKPPHIILLTMYYNSIVITLLRPLLREKRSVSFGDPALLSLEAAINTAAHLGLYNSLHTLEYSPPFASHPPLTALYVLLYNIDQPDRLGAFATIVGFLSTYSRQWPLGSMMLSLIRDMVQREAVQVPSETQEILDNASPGHGLSAYKIPESRSAYLRTLRQEVSQEIDPMEGTLSEMLQRMKGKWR